MTPTNTTWLKRGLRPCAAALFLAGFGLGLWRIAPGLDWGAQPGFAVSAHLLCTGPESGAGPFLLLAAALGRSLPGGDFPFALNIASAAAFAVAGAFLFLAAARVSGSLLLAAAAWCMVALLPEAAEVFRAARPEAGAVLAAAVMLCAGARFLHANAGARGLAAFAALGALASMHHFVIGLVALAALVLCAVRLPREQWRPGWITGAVFVFLAALLPLVFAALRPRFGIVWGPGWIEAPMEVFNLPGPSRFADTFRPGPVLLFALKQLPADFIAAPGARYFWMLAAGLAGLVAMRPGQRGFAPVAGLMFLAAPLALVLSTIRNTALFQCLLVMPFALMFVAGSGALLAEAGLARQPWIRRLAPVCLTLLVCAALWGVRPDAGRAFERTRVLAPEFAARWHGDLRRDAAAFINPVEDPFFAAPGMQLLMNHRRDVAYLFPGEFNDPAYRAMAREYAGAAMPLPTDKQYEQLKNTVTESTQVPEGAPENSALMKQRVLYNLVMLNQTIMAEDAARRRPVVFNTISMFLRNERFNWMCFKAGNASFRACHSQFTQCADSYLSSSPEIRARIQAKKKELLQDRRFLEKTIAEKYRNNPELAAPVVKLLEDHFSAGTRNTDSGETPADPWAAGDTGVRLAGFLDLEEMIRTKVIHPYVALITEASMGCDASREGFSVECAARAITDIMGRRDVDLFPMPEAAAFCFIRNFHWTWRDVERLMQDALHSPLRRDPMAARLMAGHLADAAEHAWIHKNNYLQDDDPRSESSPLRAGYRAARHAQSAALYAAAILGAPQIEPQDIPSIPAPDTDEPHLQALLENAVRLAPDNVRARFMLALVAMENDPHGALAQDHLQAVQRALTQRETSDGLNDYEMYMLVEVYQKMGLRDRSDKYLERLEGGSRLPMY